MKRFHEKQVAWRWLVWLVCLCGIGSAVAAPQRPGKLTKAQLWPGDRFPVSWYWRWSTSTHPRDRGYWSLIKRGRYREAMALWSKRCDELQARQKAGWADERLRMLSWCVSVADERCAVGQADALRMKKPQASMRHRLLAQLLVARHFLLVGQGAKARRWMRRWPRKSPTCPSASHKRSKASPSCRLRQIWKAGRALRGQIRLALLKERRQALQRQRRALRSHREAICRLPKRGRLSSSRLLRLGRMALLQKRYALSRHYLRRALATKSGPKAGRAARLLLLRVAYRERPGWPQIQAYGRFGQAEVRHPSGGQALLWAARLAMEQGEVSYAARWLRLCMTRCGVAKQRQQARFSLALLQFQRRAFARTVALLKPLTLGRGAMVARSRYWLAKAHLARRSPAKARQWLLGIRLRDDAYYAAKALKLSGLLKTQGTLWSQLARRPMRIFDLLRHATDEARSRWLIREWSRKVKRPYQLGALAQKIADDSLFRGAEQHALAARFAAVRRSFRGLRKKYRYPIVDFFLARAWLSFGQPHRAIRAASRFLTRLTPAQRRAFPFEPKMRLLYPTPYLYLFARYGQKAKLSPLLMLAVARQESLFSRKARSHVGAYGLLQMMPAVARSILQRRQGRKAALAQVTTQLAMGYLHFGRFLQAFSGQVPLALAAYNAGPVPLRRWMAQRDEWLTRRPDLFFELAIGYAETRRYIHHCLKGYSLYRYLFLDDWVSP